MFLGWSQILVIKKEPPPLPTMPTPNASLAWN